MYSGLDDEDLIPLIEAGNHQAFAEIVTRHTDRFFALAFRSLGDQADADDVVQAAFVKLWQMPHAWNANKKAKFTTWFYRIIINACHDHRRKYKRLLIVDNEILESSSQSTTCEQSGLEQRQNEQWQQDCLEQAIFELSSSQRDALNLVVYGGLQQKHAADIMGISLKAIESLLHRAKKSLQQSINKTKHNIEPTTQRHVASKNGVIK